MRGGMSLHRMALALLGSSTLLACMPSRGADADAVARPEGEPGPESAPESALQTPPPTEDGHEPAAAVDRVDAAQAAGMDAGTEALAPRRAAERPRSKIRSRHVVVSNDIQPGLAAFARAMPQEGCLWTGRLAGNGERDVLVFVPPGADDDASTRLVYHFHGTYSEHIEQKRPGLKKKKWVGWNRLQQTIDAATELQEKNPYNVALVYPLSAGKRREPGLTGWNNRAYDRMWMMPADEPGYDDSFDGLHDEVVDVLEQQCGVHPAALDRHVIAEGHSAGGIALRNIAVSGTKRVTEYIFQDASFQGWADGCWQALQDRGSDALVTVVLTDGGIADPYGKHDPWCEWLPQRTAAWTVHERWCAEHGPDATPPGVEPPCKALQEAAEQWPDHEQWCEALTNDLEDLPGAFLHRTPVYHGEQPRRFTGALELPPDRLEQDRKTAAGN